MITSTDVPAILGARFPLLKIEKKKMINGSVITIKIIFLASTFLTLLVKCQLTQCKNIWQLYEFADNHMSQQNASSLAMFFNDF